MITSGVFDRPAFDPQQHRSSIVSLIVPGDAKSFARALLKQKVNCTERGGYLRIAPHFCNTDDEVERAARLLNGMNG